jgi:6-phosphogluconate dehydrogenase
MVLLNPNSGKEPDRAQLWEARCIIFSQIISKIMEDFADFAFKYETLTEPVPEDLTEMIQVLGAKVTAAGTTWQGFTMQFAAEAEKK